MEDQIISIISRSLFFPNEESIYSELQSVLENSSSIFDLIQISSRQDLEHNIRFISLTLIRQIILNNFSIPTQPNYEFLNGVSYQVSTKLLNIFYNPSELRLVPQLSAICSLLKLRLQLFYSLLTEGNLMEIPQPTFLNNITEKLIEIIQNEQIFQNAFTITYEFLTHFEGSQIDTGISKEFFKFFYQFLLNPEYSTITLKIMYLIHDYSQIPFLLKNLNQITQKDNIIEITRMLTSFYFVSNEANLEDLDLFNFVVEFLIECLKKNKEENSISFESALFFNNLMLNLFKLPTLNQVVFNHLNELIYCLFEKTGNDQNIDFFGISRISLKTLHLISISFPSETFSIIFPIIESTFSNQLNPFQAICSIRTFSKILTKKNDFLLNSPSLLSILKFSIDLSMNFIQIPEFAADSAMLFNKSFKILVMLQNNEEINAFQTGNNGFKQIIHAFCIYNYEIKIKLSKVIRSLLCICPIPLELFLSKIINTFIHSNSLNEYIVNSIVLVTFIEKSFRQQNENNNTDEINYFIQFILNSIDDNNFLIISIQIFIALIRKFPEFISSIIPNLWPKILELLSIYSSNNFAAFYQYDKKINNDNISTFFWIFQFIINVNEVSFAMNSDISQLLEPIIRLIPSFLNSSLPKFVILSTLMLLNSLLKVTIKYLHNYKDQQKEEIQFEFNGKLKLFNVLSQCIKNFVLSQQDLLNNIDDDISISILGTISSIVFAILKDAPYFLLPSMGFDFNEVNNFPFLFSPVNEAQTVILLLLHLFDCDNFKYSGFLENATCCICLLLQYPSVAEQLHEFISPEMMEKIIKMFSLIKDQDIKLLIAPGISALFHINATS